LGLFCAAFSLHVKALLTTKIVDWHLNMRVRKDFSTKVLVRQRPTVCNSMTKTIIMTITCKTHHGNVKLLEEKEKKNRRSKHPLRVRTLKRNPKILNFFP
jgi:hypothetical protein